MIVVVVIAFVVLGLGLGFVRTQFKDIGATTSAVQEQIKQQILDDLRTGNKKLGFPATQVKAEAGEEVVQAIGIKNTDDLAIKVKVNFWVQNGGPTDGFTEFKPGVQLPWVRATDNEDITARVDWDNSPQDLARGDSRVMPVTIKAPSREGNLLYKIEVVKIENNVEVPYDTKTFFVKT